MKNNEIINIVLGILPYTNQISNIDTTSEDNAIRFDWRGSTFRVSNTLSVESVQGRLRVSDNTSILMETLLKGLNINYDIK